MSLKKAPGRPTIARLEVVVMPNGEVLCLGRTIGWIKQLGPYLDVPTADVGEQRGESA